jgi:hypothetical protein
MLPQAMLARHVSMVVPLAVHVLPAVVRPVLMFEGFVKTKCDSVGQVAIDVCHWMGLNLFKPFHAVDSNSILG